MAKKRTASAARESDAPARRVLSASRRLARHVQQMRFPAPVRYVYNPLVYAWAPYRDYVTRYADGTRRVLFLGMNPGPWGMAQTGVPFGEVRVVRDWLGIRGRITAPSREHPDRPVLGWDCPRSEVSGRRLWGLFREYRSDALEFFAEHFVINYCPLLFLEASGRNLTPDKLPAGPRAELLSACDLHLGEVADALESECIVGVGAFAQKCAERVLGDRLRVVRISHPSPANPSANRDWAKRTHAQLVAEGVWS